MMAGLPSQVAALRKDIAAVRAEIEHVQEALGDIMRDLDANARCLGLVLKITRHLHTLTQKMRDAARTRR